MTQVQHHKKLNFLQMYRGFAAVVILLFHLSSMSKAQLNISTFGKIFDAGWNGVAYFLVLSAFILIYIHENEIGKPHYFKAFWLKRIIRIYPIYVILTLAVTAFLLGFPVFAKYSMTPLYIIKSLLILPLLFEGQHTILEPAWILCYQVFFYILFSIAILLKPKYSFPLLSAWALIVLLRHMKLIQFPENWAGFAEIFSYLHLQFIMGVIAAFAILHLNLHRLIKYRWPLFGVANAVYVLLSLAIAYQWISFDGGTAFAFIWSLIIISSTYIDTHDSVQIPSFLLYLGEASYSIYLTHSLILLGFIQGITKMSMSGLMNNLFIQTLIALITLGIGCLFYSLVEKPLTQYLQKKFLTPQT